jgi:FixJ family two-component response regulator
VRVPTTATVAEVWARLNRHQQDALVQAMRAQTAVRDQEQALELAKLEVGRRVFRAMARGVPARILAEELGLSESRIYQLRDQHRPQAT